MSAHLAPTTLSPAPVSVIRWQVVRTVRAIRAIFRAINHRRDVTRLLELGERELKDIGLGRGDVLGALAGPLHHDPSVPLRLRAIEHRTRVREVEKAVDKARRGSPAA